MVTSKKIFPWLILLYLALFPFGQLVRLPISAKNEFPEINVYLTDLVVGIGAFLWVRSRIVVRNLRFPPFAKEIFAFIFIALFSLLLATPLAQSREVAIASLYLLRWVAYSLWFFMVWEAVGEKPKFSKTLSFSLILVGVAVAVFGWIQYFVYPDLRPFVEFGWDEHYLRIVGTFLDPGFTAIIIVLSILLVFAILVKEGHVTYINISYKRLILLGVLAFLFITLAFTYSRAGYLAFLAGSLVFSWQKKLAKIFLVSLALLLLTITLLPRPQSEGVKLERVVTAQARLENWRETLQIAAKSPIFGVGFNTLRYVREQENIPVVGFAGEPSHSGAGSDSSLLFVLATTGVVGLLVYLNLGLSIVREVPKILPIFGALLIHSLFLNSLFYPWVLGFLAILLALFLPQPEKATGNPRV